MKNVRIAKHSRPRVSARFRNERKAAVAAFQRTVTHPNSTVGRAQLAKFRGSLIFERLAAILETGFNSGKTLKQRQAILAVYGHDIPPGTLYRWFKKLQLPRKYNK